MREKGTLLEKPTPRQQVLEKSLDKQEPLKEGGGRVIRALSDIMKRGNLFRGAF